MLGSHAALLGREETLIICLLQDGKTAEDLAKSEQHEHVAGLLARLRKVSLHLRLSAWVHVRCYWCFPCGLLEGGIGHRLRKIIRPCTVFGTRVSVSTRFSTVVTKTNLGPRRMGSVDKNTAEDQSSIPDIYMADHNHLQTPCFQDSAPLLASTGTRLAGASQTDTQTSLMFPPSLCWSCLLNPLWGGGRLLTMMPLSLFCFEFPGIS